MKARVMMLAMVLAISTNIAWADAARDRVERGIASVEQLIDAHEWREAFAKLREVEQSAGTDALKYLTAKQRYRMYARLNKNAETRTCMSQMETLALHSADQATIEDMLMTKAAYNGKIGNANVMKNCYREILDRRANGKDDKEREAVMKLMIDEAKQTGNKSMQGVISEIYANWQDSIAALNAAREIEVLKDSCANAITKIESRDSKINWQRGAIIFLILLIASAIVALLIVVPLWLRSIQVSNKLRKTLQVSETGSAQKSAFMQNIVAQINPSLEQIAAGNTRTHVVALQQMLADVEQYMAVESTKEEKYETSNTNVSKLCDELVTYFSGRRIQVHSEAPKMQFTLPYDAVKQVLTALVEEAQSCNDTERIDISFKKRNPHLGQFMVTAVGMHVSEDQCKSMFIPFAEVYDLTQTTGLVLPICAMMAYKMGGELKLDESFSKGTRFLLEVKS